MKVSALILMVLAPTFSLAGELDGKSFCRTIVSDGLFGQPAGERQHCVSFENNIMTDDANTFFGNPPESLNYVLVGGKILVVRNGSLQSEYSTNNTLSEIKNEVAATLLLTK